MQSEVKAGDRVTHIDPSNSNWDAIVDRIYGGSAVDESVAFFVGGGFMRVRVRDRSTAGLSDAPKKRLASSSASNCLSTSSVKIESEIFVSFTKAEFFSFDFCRK